MPRSIIVGTGQIAKCFQNFTLNNVVIFASGVSNSNTTDIAQFAREKFLLIKTLEANKDKKFVYFSSCAITASEYPKNEYYRHKEDMENIIKKHSDCFYIFRIPQLFGDLILHKTLINFIYKAIMHNHAFNVYDEAYRYVIEINDLRKIVELCLINNNACITIDLANPYQYKVLDIVEIFEKLLNKKANYNLIHKEDRYYLNLSEIEELIKKADLDLDFGENYLIKKLKEKLHE